MTSSGQLTKSSTNRDVENFLLTQAEAAQFLRVTTRTIRRWAHQGRIQQVRVGNKAVRYPTESIVAFLATSTGSGDPLHAKRSLADTKDLFKTYDLDHEEGNDQTR
jgi:excisionase family DNA binding protein